MELYLVYSQYIFNNSFLGSVNQHHARNRIIIHFLLPYKPVSHLKTLSMIHLMLVQILSDSSSFVVKLLLYISKNSFVILFPSVTSSRIVLYILSVAHPQDIDHSYNAYQKCLLSSIDMLQNDRKNLMLHLVKVPAFSQSIQ